MARWLSAVSPHGAATITDRDESGGLVRKAGIMGIVLADGHVRPGNPIGVEFPRRPHARLRPV